MRRNGPRCRTSAAQQVGSQVRDWAPACPPMWAPLDRDGTSYPKSVFRQCFTGAGCLLGAAGFRHDQHLLLLPRGLLLGVCKRREFFCYFCVAPKGKGAKIFSQKTSPISTVATTCGSSKPVASLKASKKTQLVERHDTTRSEKPQSATSRMRSLGFRLSSGT